MRKKSGSKIVCGILCLLLTALFALPAAAAGNQLTVSYHDGVTFSLYFVADKSGNLKETFANSGLSIPDDSASNEAKQNAALHFRDYVNEYRISADHTGTTNGGRVTFSNLAEGYYLVTGRQTTIGTTTYQPTPVLVKVPGNSQINPKDDGGTTVTPPGTVSHPTTPPGSSSRPETPGSSSEPETPGSSSKPETPGSSSEPETPGSSSEPETPGSSSEPDTPGSSSEPETPGSSSEPETPGTPGAPAGPGNPGGGTPGTPGNGGKLPKTGQLWWPVPVLFCAGTALIVAGTIEHHRAKQTGRHGA